ncbi:hypothetical protein PanWU01x14_159560 [Parasponia andersonii]|uniref:Uncharacterized protein n=1 Tax=Parasponia andersonii TaxID=3476 RepID=A0A2P5CEI9_PARAD|nr:hypothetical protein PanWU01x14_159560 [Parasponia andersonii]
MLLLNLSIPIFGNVFLHVTDLVAKGTWRSIGDGQASISGLTHPWAPVGGNYRPEPRVEPGPAFPRRSLARLMGGYGLELSLAVSLLAIEETSEHIFLFCPCTRPICLCPDGEFECKLLGVVPEVMHLEHNKSLDIHQIFKCMETLSLEHTKALTTLSSLPKQLACVKLNLDVNVPFVESEIVEQRQLQQLLKSGWRLSGSDERLLPRKGDSISWVARRLLLNGLALLRGANDWACFCEFCSA